MTGSDRLRRQHARQVSRAARPGDDDPDPAARSLLGVAEQMVRRAMRGHDPKLGWDAELRQHRDGVLEDGEVRAAPADDADQGARGVGRHAGRPDTSASSSVHRSSSTAARARARASSVDGPIAVTWPIFRRSNTWRLS